MTTRSHQTNGSSPGTAISHVVNWLRAAIIDGRLKPGQQVKQERVSGETGLSLGPVREALRVLEQEGQMTYIPRRGYFVTKLEISDLEEIYELRRILEPIAVRRTVPLLQEEDFVRLSDAASRCADAAARGDVALELDANREFHFGLMTAPGQPHLIKVITSLWDSTEAYRALYYNLPEERQAATMAHQGILRTAESGEIETMIEMLDAHRDRALVTLRGVLEFSEKVNPESKP